MPIKKSRTDWSRSYDRTSAGNCSARASRASLGAVRYVTQQQAAGFIDVNRYSTIAQNLVQQEVLWAQASGSIAQGLVTVYRALGGGWEIRLDGEEALEAPLPDAITPADMPEEPGTAAPETTAPDSAEGAPAPMPNAPRELA